jgi:hypothetical protein
VKKVKWGEERGRGEEEVEEEGMSGEEEEKRIEEVKEKEKWRLKRE